MVFAKLLKRVCNAADRSRIGREVVHSLCNRKRSGGVWWANPAFQEAANGHHALDQQGVEIELPPSSHQSVLAQLF